MLSSIEIWGCGEYTSWRKNPAVDVSSIFCRNFDHVGALWNYRQHECTVKLNETYLLAWQHGTMGDYVLRLSTSSHLGKGETRCPWLYLFQHFFFANWSPWAGITFSHPLLVLLFEQEVHNMHPGRGWNNQLEFLYHMLHFFCPGKSPENEKLAGTLLGALAAVQVHGTAPPLPRPRPLLFRHTTTPSTTATTTPSTCCSSTMPIIWRQQPAAWPRGYDDWLHEDHDWLCWEAAEAWWGGVLVGKGEAS